jgi:D-beta-D-heptose 7-phosphate kinase/D-beta-D-heptose 1-phosphate adenosyltransferase
MRVALSGCFDLFHDGHKHLLDTAFDIIVWSPHCVGELTIFINSDKSIRKLKGNNRPIEKIETRIEKINQYLKKKFIHHPGTSYKIIVFNTEKQLLNGYKKFKPNVIIHGSDIKNLTDVTGYGLYPYIFLPRKKRRGKDISTTEIINEQALRS